MKLKRAFRLARLDRLYLFIEQTGTCANCGEEMTVDKSVCNTDRYATFFAVPHGGRWRRRPGTVLLVCRMCNRILSSKQA